jgi:hypothetical protein
MPIDLQSERLLSLNEAARLLPASRRGRPVHLSCIYRWLMDGIQTPHGKVRLEGIRLGGRWLTSVEALERFAQAQTPDLTNRPQLPRNSAARQRASERAGARLRRIGI